MGVTFCNFCPVLLGYMGKRFATTSPRIVLLVLTILEQRIVDLLLSVQLNIVSYMRVRAPSLPQFRYEP